MEVGVRYYAAIRDIIGLTDEKFDVKNGTTLGCLVNKVKKSHPEIKDMILLVAVNEKYSKPENLLADGDRVALFPPVSGG